MRKFFALFGSVFAVLTVSAAEIYVSPNGKAGNPGTAEAPMKSIRSAVNKAQPGDTVKLLPGVYRENVTVRKSGTAEKPIVISGVRAADGTYQAILEPVGRVLTDWTPAPEIGANVWKTPLEKRPNLVLMDGRMIAQINNYNMQIPRRQPLPDLLTEELVWGEYFPPAKSKRLSGLDLLATSKDIRLTHRYFRYRDENGKTAYRKELFWPAVGNVLCGWFKGNLYLRFAADDTPDKHNLTVSYGSGLALNGCKNVVLRDLCMRGSSVQIYINNSSDIVVENSLLMHGSCRIKIDKEASNIIVRNNILTCGFIQDKHFGQPLSDDVRGRLTYLIFKYIIGTATSDDYGVDVCGKDCQIYDNVIVNGLLGVEGSGPGAKVYNNSIKSMSSCGIITGKRSSGEYYENLVIDCGIPLRIHDWRHEKFYRTEYHYRNLFIQSPFEGSLVHIYSASNKVGPDKVNFDKDGIYKENPPAPFDPGKIFIYHNTFIGGTDSGTPFPAKPYYKRFRNQPLPFYFVNNIIKSTYSWDMRHQAMLAGNLLYVSKRPYQVSVPHDKKVFEFNRHAPTEQIDTIWKNLYDKGIPDIRLQEKSPALECALDVSREFTSNNSKSDALPGFKPGYYQGKAPAAGALQPGDDRLMDKFRKMYEKLLKAEEIIKKQH